MTGGSGEEVGETGNGPEEATGELEEGVLEMAEPPETGSREGSDGEGDLDLEVPLASALEAILFAAAEPIPLQRLSRLFQGRGPGAVKEALSELRDSFQEGGRGIRLVEVSSGYQLRSAPEHGHWLRRFFAERPPRLSRALLETVAIIAYRQPVTRGEIEAIRGVNCDAILTALTTRELVKVLGRRDTPGRPVEYGTSSGFLELFTLKNLSELPPLPDAESLADLLRDAPADGSETDQSAEGGDQPVEKPDEGDGPSGGLGLDSDSEVPVEDRAAWVKPEESVEEELEKREGSAGSTDHDPPQRAAALAATASAGVGTPPAGTTAVDKEVQANGTERTDSEDSQPGGSGLSPSGGGTDS